MIEYIRFNPKTISDCYCMLDFYNRIGVTEILSKNGINEFDNIYMNPSQVKWLRTIFKNNILQNSLYRSFSKDFLYEMVDLDVSSKITKVSDCIYPNTVAVVL